MEKVTKKIFVGSIPHTVTEEEFRKKVEEHGSVTALFYMKDQTEGDRGWAFVTYETVYDAQNAIEALNEKHLFNDSSGPALEVRFANQKPGSNSTSFQNKPASAAPGPSVWQEYFTPEGYAYYYNTSTGVTQWEKPEDFDKPAPVVVSRPASVGIVNHAATRFGPPGSNVFVANLPYEWNDIDLIQHFQHFGNILSARIQRGTEGNSRGFGFVSFDNSQAAVNAIRGMNGFSCGGRYLRVFLKKGEEHYLTAAMQAQVAQYLEADRRPRQSARPY
ncbi:clustered-asparagine-rich protein [Toxoplasma gondii ME49]|uniref:Clustered-asparagine-rich protein n=15 Tax=Toxoplasma gondii TaxID=5811 RepID=A0A125YFB5_TOXGV|nr:clustered-asparagine-rich protein [Toxoplasma gondii ME49]EPR57837.1 clustered-asparagine-rich protein [Toxoplasma gondii GT1]ESS29573.1 clustered-asparagine-rich protein [Toxoplasma gondii VEG]KAF4645802.1 clustered-asparagine-rich protein [Toxoplasma gondii]KFG28087.1 clustered-asparagine-rich protein [Toxoplasma gondii p89]KFG29851.1 clustered-asparagine-rich protein [Toxoplasma gondii GAB2-2007-GAL-DOM2]KFG60405.1 clustered-asparagine-rich protein [Toxoplasma gondii RUB]KFH05376.1 clu|eukprot:XP_002371678.1 clustered-asparagine-rich protein [Toxoplasma gondii ME49]